MHRWSETAARISATSRTSEKVGTLAAYLQTLSAEELPLAVRYMTGRPFAERESRTTGIGWAAIAATAQELVGARAGALGAAYNDSSDLGKAVFDLFASHEFEPVDHPPSLPEVDAAFTAVAAARGAGPKGAALRALLERCDALC